MSSENVTTTTMASAMATNAGLTCGEELMSWMDEAWLTLIPLLISIAFAVAVESSMVSLKYKR